MKHKGININWWSTVIFILVTAVMTLFGVKMREASQYVREQAQIENSRRMCEQESQILSDGSDYLTNEVFHFIATGDRAHLDNYWYEVEQIKSRDRAVEHLSALSLTDEEQRLVESAKKASDNLIKKEAWAMRLTADSMGIEVSETPKAVAAVQYVNGEDALTPAQKINLASEYLFGAEYTGAKQIIKNDLESFRTLLRNRKHSELENAVSNSVSALAMGRTLMVILIAAFGIESLLFYISIIRPLNHYTRALRQMDGSGFTALPPMGAKEIQAFATVFDQIYSEWTQQKERLEKERYRFHVALDNTSIIVYEYETATDTFMAFGDIESSSDASSQTLKENVIPGFLKEHAASLMGRQGVDYFHSMLEGKVCVQAELQFRSSGDDSHMVWVRITGTPIYDENQKVTRLIGKIINIQGEKEKEFALEDARSRDGLTGLYKREAGIRKVRDYMAGKSPDDVCCMMLLDMDNFGELNEKEGSVFADAMLQDAASILRAQTGPDDLLARLGGDEFMLFIKNCDKSRAAKLGPGIAAGIRKLSNQHSPGISVSASIGMCVTEVVDEYSGLYRCAESALNYVKEHGKGWAACYLDVSNKLGMMLTQMYPRRRRINKINRTDGGWEDLPGLALDLLGKSKNLDDAIFLLLSKVGGSVDVDRILIVELNTEYLSSRTLYQWSREPGDRMPEEPIYITQEEMDAISRCYDTEGLSQQRIITRTHRSSMESILHAAIWNYGQCVGAMSFELRKPHKWTGEERQLLGDLTRIISSFTLKARADAVSRAKTDFLSRMSHEIRTPMNAITGMTIIAKTVPNNPPKTLDCLNKIESANKYLLSLINDVLDMSRIESGKAEIHLTAVSMGKMAENLDTLIRPQTDEKGILLLVNNGLESRRRMLADELRLNQVLVNLLGNAVKFTDEGGTVSLDIQPLKADSQSALVRFTVTDTGIGISQEAQGRIFNAFEQADGGTSANYGGTGLGLSISSRLVQLMGGKLEVESQPGKGASFFFTLRLSYASVTDEEETVLPEDSDTPYDPAGKRLLLVEDNALNQEIAQEILEMHGFLVETANNGKEAVEAFKDSAPGHYDAVLMDIRMPVMGGIEATRLIRTMGKEDSRTVPILAMTANAFDEDMKNSLENGMNGHLSKPIDVNALLNALRRLITSAART